MRRGASRAFRGTAEKNVLPRNRIEAILELGPRQSKCGADLRHFGSDKWHCLPSVHLRTGRSFPTFPQPPRRTLFAAARFGPFCTNGYAIAQQPAHGRVYRDDRTKWRLNRQVHSGATNTRSGTRGFAVPTPRQGIASSIGRDPARRPARQRSQPAWSFGHE